MLNNYIRLWIILIQSKDILKQDVILFDPEDYKTIFSSIKDTRFHIFIKHILSKLELLNINIRFENLTAYDFDTLSHSICVALTEKNSEQALDLDEIKGLMLSLEIEPLIHVCKEPELKVNLASILML